MVVTEAGQITGVISGGCLEADVRGRAFRAMQQGRPVLVKYDTTTNEELVWGLGLGCNGVVHVLIEPASDSTDDLVRVLDSCSTGQHRTAVATIIRSENARVPLGARAILSQDRPCAFHVDWTSDRIAQRILSDLQAALGTGTSSITRYGGHEELEAFIEVVDPPLPLVIFGAGADVVPLVAVARQLGWHTTVVDTHSRARSVQRFVLADSVILCRPEDVCNRVTVTPSSVVVLMTHNYQHDGELLHSLMNSTPRYIGCLGPRHRAARLLSDVVDDPAASLHAALHGPIGLDVGAETSSEIAVSIAAEILAVLKDRSGASLRHRQGSIHEAAEPSRVLTVAAQELSSTNQTM